MCHDISNLLRCSACLHIESREWDAASMQSSPCTIPDPHHDNDSMTLPWSGTARSLIAVPNQVNIIAV